MYGELEENGEPVGYHLGVGDRGTQIFQRLKMRAQARQSYFHVHASQLLSRTARNRTRAWSEPQIGDRCFFFREIRQKGVKGTIKKWQGPALVVGIQGQSNVWVVFGGRCFLVAQEHCREAVGEESLFGRPEAQDAIGIFRGMIQPGAGTGYKDLTDQDNPDDKPLDDIPMEEDVIDDDDSMEVEHQGNPNRGDQIPQELAEMCGAPGWNKIWLGIR